MPAQNYVLLERIELNASAASVTFSNIPQSGYTDLKVVVSGRSTASAVNDNLWMKFNGNNSSYSNRVLYGSGSSVASGANTGTGDTQYLAPVPGATATASTFGNSEIYIPNYTGSQNKSVSLDGVAENNATLAYSQIQAILWSNTAAITSIQFGLITGSYVANSTFSLYGLAAVGTTPVIAPKASGGDRIDYDGTYWIHTFTTTGAFVPQTTLSCDYLVIGGGGGSGGEAGAGGGAGGYLTSVGTQGGGVSAGSPLSLAATSYTVTVGAGGAGGYSTGGSGGGIGGTGSNSVLSTITALGGGGGSGYADAGAGVSINGNPGGSGGGGGNGGSGSVGLGGAASAPTQGYAGGTGAYTFPNGRGMGGGGGAGSVGANGVTATGTGGNGGAGITSSISGTSVARAGGGGGAGQSVQGTGTAGGGTNSAGTVNTGGGGSDNYTFNGGNPGGSGIVIIRYLAA